SIGANSVFALCKDNTVWWWGDNLLGGFTPPNGPMEVWGLDLKDGSWVSDGNAVWSPPSGDFHRVELWKPTHLTALDPIAAVSPIIQIAGSDRCFIALRQDGKVFEFGYVP